MRRPPGPHRGPHGPHGRRGRGARTRWQEPDGTWHVDARVERFAEPVLLMLLRERERHGYELLELLPEWIGERRVDLGNLYRLLRSMEDDGIVASRWDEEAEGPAKRVYWLTDSGRALLDRWAEGLTELRSRVERVLDEHDRGKGVST